jgi:hypothetical protein
MQISQLWQKYKFLILALGVVGILISYNMLSIQYQPASATTEEVEEAPPAIPRGAEGFEAMDASGSLPTPGPAQMNPLDLLPSNAGILEPNLKSMLEIPSKRTITERVGQHRETNKNPYIIAGIQFKQPEVSKQSLNVNIPTIQTAPGFANAMF